MTVVDYNALVDLATACFEQVGVPPEDARLCATILTTADLRGIDSHGVARLRIYVKRVQNGLINPRPEVSIISQFPAAVSLDAGNGLGPAVAHRAMTLCLERAAECGSCLVSVRNSNHFGIAGYYSMMALERDMIGLAMTNAAPRVVPTFSRQPMLGTNPISVAFPTAEERPLVVDMATSTVAWGKVEIRARTGEPLPIGWALDSEGLPTTDPLRAKAAEALMPLGGTADTSGYKGYALASMVDALCGVLAGANWGIHIPQTLSVDDPEPRIGHFFGAWRVDAFRPVAEFKADMDRMIRTLHGGEKAADADRIYVAGEREWELSDQRRAEGIPLHAKVLADLTDLAQSLDVPVPW
jgi:L-2-hydroxycarboxylate dehydrogenase (NAD+)